MTTDGRASGAGSDVDADDRIAEAEALVVRGEFAEALDLFEDLLVGGVVEERTLAGAGRSLLEVVRAAQADGGGAGGRDALHRALIIPEGWDGRPVFPHLLTSHAQSTDPASLRRLVAALAPTLESLHRSGVVHKNFVLTLLMLRAGLEGVISQAEVARLHRERFHTFDLEDLAVPYNAMFTKPPAAIANMAEMAGFVGDPASSEAFLGGLRLSQIVFLEWLLKTRLVGRPGVGEVRDAIRARLVRGRHLPDELAAAKSLLVTHGWGAGGPEPAFLAAEGLGEALAPLIDSVAETRRSFGPPPPRATLDDRLWRSRPWQYLQAAGHMASQRLPALHLGRRKPRIALCVSGQLRGYRAAFETWKRHLLPHFEHDIYVHSWTRVGRSGAEPSRTVLPFEGPSFSAAYRAACRRLPFAELKQRQPALFRDLAATGVVTEAQIAELYGSDHVRLDDETQPPFDAWTNADKMHGKMEASYRLMEAAGREYDLIFRMRPDRALSVMAYSPRALRRICGRRPVIFADHGAGQQFAFPQIGDQIAVGAPGVMRAYSTTWSLYPAFAENGLFRCPPPMMGHITLAHNCLIHGISVEKMPGAGGSLLDPEPLSSPDIRRSLEEDAQGRMDPLDLLLLEAVAEDLKARP